MGTVYYLAREDNHTLFDLGKAYAAAREWRAGMRHWEAPVVVDLFLGPLLKVLRTGLGCEPDTPYLCEVIRRIRRFADGHEVTLLDDDDLEGRAPLNLYRDENGDLRVVDSRFTDDWT